MPRTVGATGKATKDIRQIARKYSGETAIKAIKELAENAESEETRLRAWRELLDRGYGRPKQDIEHGGGLVMEHIERIIVSSQDPDG